MSVKRKRQKIDGQIEEIRYSGGIPDEILDELTPEIIEQYFIWDEVTKRELELYPRLILPLIKEVFHKEYLPEVEIKLLATEYVVRRLHKEGGSTINSIYADLAVQIENRDIYHLECQMEQNGEMVLRMFEYDIHIGLVYGVRNTFTDMASEAKLEILMPKSVILYLSDAGNIPAEEVCRICFADGTTHDYRVPVVKVQDYTPEMIGNKHLNMLIPYLPIRFRKHINQKSGGVKVRASEEIKKDLTDFIRKCIMIIDREKRNGTLTDMAGKDLIEFLSITCGYLLKNQPELKREVHEIMKPTILLTREKADIKIKLIREEAEEEIKRIKEEVKRIEEEAKKITEDKEEEIKKIKEDKEEEIKKITEDKEEEIKKIKEDIERIEEEAKEKQENSIRKAIERGQKSGQSYQEVQESIQDIFAMNDVEAKEKLSKYWKD